MHTVAIIGLGRVGLALAAGFAEFGHRVIGTDPDNGKIEKFLQGDPVIYEPGLRECMRRNIEAGKLSFTAECTEAVRVSDVVFISVNTPSMETGDADLRCFHKAAETVAANLDHYTVIVVKSTVSVGTSRSLAEGIQVEYPKADFDVVSNPEFLREGRALKDFFHPDRVVLGLASERARVVMEDVYGALKLTSVPFVVCDFETAELIKYACNAFLAVKIGFINEIANLADAAGADIDVIAKAMGMDGRIGPKFLHAGPGFGGTCLPKDCRALMAMGEHLKAEQVIVKSVLASNERQIHKPVEKLKKHLTILRGKRIAVLGLSFKAGSERVDNSAALTIIRDLHIEGAEIVVHDPEAMDECRKIVPSIEYADSHMKALVDVDAVVIATEWDEYRGIDLQAAETAMRGTVIIDCRNILSPEKVSAAGLIYEGMGRGTI